MMRLHTQRLWDLWRSRDERGQTLVEYGLLLTFIALVVIAAIIVLGTTTSGFFQDFINEVPW